MNGKIADPCVVTMTALSKTKTTMMGASHQSFRALKKMKNSLKSAPTLLLPIKTPFRKVSPNLRLSWNKSQ